MTIDASHLLTMLEPAVRPAAAPPLRAGAGSRAQQAAPFRDMLALYAHEAYPMPPTGRGLAVDGAHLTAPLDEDALARLAAAAEQAERAGATRAIMIYDGRGIVVDVRTRTIERELEAAHSAPLTDVDAAVYVATADEGVAAPSLRLPEAGFIPSSIMEQIEMASSYALRAGNREETKSGSSEAAPR